ncbi:DUF4105 domain-containing protein [Bdellovibrio sp. ArHS]|uniref:DUF7844 domain-containing protein n=1 Tax=Bdellovibrio sp. ArHS TaxID=1569284 RepID=UPI000AAA5681|nr:DUF4105 domain-containing protein [Bdellovibrio sp. ArHS]
MKHKPFVLRSFAFFVMISISANALAKPNEGLVTEIYHQALQKLPPMMQNTLTKARVQVDPSFSDPDHIAYQKGKSIFVGKTFLSLATFWGQRRAITDATVVKTTGLDFQKKSFHHRNVDQFLIATLIHEAAHIYDQARDFTALESNAIVNCLNDGGTTGLSCELYRNRRFSISDSHTFLNLVGWVAQSSLNHRRLNELLLSRSPDPYEYSSPQEAFAVNLEYFLLDPEYKCRRPFHYEFFKSRFDWAPFPSTTCPELNNTVFVTDPSSFSKTSMALDPERLYAVDYLLAGPGPEVMSRWGHAMIRFIFCPKNTPLQESCRNNTANSIVLSFRARVDELFINNAMGLQGKYDSVAFFYPMASIITEYNTNELRDLQSFEIPLTKEQRKKFLSAAIYSHWNHQGRYYFLSNNCATETLNLMKFAFPENELLQEVFATTPISLAETLKQIGAIQSLQKRPGYSYPSKLRVFSDAIKNLNEKLGTSFRSLEDYASWNETSKSRHFANLQSLPRITLLNLYLLENRHYALLRVNTWSQIYRSLEKNGDDFVINDSYKKVSLLNRNTSTPGLLLSSKSYGMPLKNEVEDLNDSDLWPRIDEASQDFKSAREHLQSKYAPLLNDVVVAEQRLRVLQALF